MCRGGVHICRLKRTVVRFPLLFSVDLNFALYKYKYRIIIPFHLLNHPSRRPVLTRGAASYPPGLAALSCTLTSLRGLRLARSPLRYRLASPPPRSEPRLLSCPHAPRLRSPRPPLSTGWCHRPSLSSCRMGLRSRSRGACGQMFSPVRSGTPPLLLPDGLAPSEPRSVRADVIPGSERSAATATRQRGGGARRVDRGGGARRPPFGRAAERARSAARASSGHPPAHSAPTPPDPLLAPFYPLSPPPSLLSPPAGWAGVLGAAERAGRCYPRFGAARRPPPRVSGAVERAA